KEGLIYKDKRLVNWDPELQTAISDLEVVQVETKGHLWHFKYPVVDDDGRETGEFIVVATTRPETMLGDTAVAVHPTDARYLHLHGKRVRLPLVGRFIPIVADEYSDPEKGTGAVKITPAHDFNDFEVGRRHQHEGVRLINILDAEGRITVADNAIVREGGSLRVVPREEAAAPHGPSFPVIASAGRQLVGLDRFEARKRIVAQMEELGFLDKIEPHTHMVPHGDRTGVVLEPRLTDQWYVDAKTLAQPALAAVRSGKTSFIPKNWEKTYFAWLENIQPWCISRQLWWGHQIPAWYGPSVLETPDGYRFNSNLNFKNRFVAENEAAARSQAEEYYRSFFIATPLIVVSDETEADRLLRVGAANIPFYRDPDVLDTWFSSALWPFSTLGWPHETPELKCRYPTSVLVTGFDIIFFWVARMMMMGLHFMHEVPFSNVYIHALVRDEKGAKMSKSKGNVVDPLHLIKTYGADALRFTLAAMAAQGRDIKLSAQRIEGYRNFGTKLWNAARFAEMNGCVFEAAFDPRQTTLSLNGWIVGETAKAIAEVTGAIETYRFNDAANAAYRFVWNIFCDWYLELAKPLLQGADGTGKIETRATTAFVLDKILKLLHPFMPFITEELWAIKGTEGSPCATLLALAEWPRLEDFKNLDQADLVVGSMAASEAPDVAEVVGLVGPQAEIGWILDLVSEVRSVRAEMNVPAAAQIPLVLIDASEEVKSRAEKWEETIKLLARLSEISFSPEAPVQSVQMIVRTTVAALPLQGIIDFDAVKTRLAKEIAKLKGDADKIEAKLRNADFVARAPEDVVDENRERREDALSRMEKLAAALARLGGA
ncbi:MAG: valine--tRNA ligase, partial [Pseudomonadota bacterium]|nr:valine--tRNA ligase [Pseudomonadota bacterium]